MSRVIEFMDGAERGDLTWWTSSTGFSVSSVVPIHGTYCYTSTLNIANSAIKTLTSPVSDFYFRCYANVAFPDANIALRFRSSSTSLLTLTYDVVLARWNITGGATGNTGNSSFPGSTWKCLEVHYKISDTVGEVTIRIDGVQVFTFSGDTKPGTETTVDNIQIYFGGLYLDDFALDTSTWCGLGYYIGLTANGAGDSTQWTPTGAANYQNVSIPANDATYNSGTTGQTDNYAMTSLTVGTGGVLRVVPFARANNAAGGSVNIGLKTNGTNYTTTVTTPTSLTWLAGAEYINNPQTSSNWVQAEMDAVQFTVSVP